MEELLKNKLLQKFKNPVNTAKDCELLSKEINIETNRNISASTLRRFFGLLPSKSNLSRYNLDTLAIFCGAKDYKAFIENNSTHKPEGKSGINSVMNDLTKFTLSSISKKTLGDFEKTIPREGFHKELNRFIQSEFLIYPVIAPGGYGKSIALAHWVETLNTEEREALFCTASVFNQLISSTGNFKIKSPDNIFEKISYIDKHLVLIIDSVDELSSNTKKVDAVLNYIMELIQNYKDKLKVKVVFSTRESFWNKILKPDLTKLLNEKKLSHIIYRTEFGVNDFLEFSLSEINSLTDLNEISETFQYHSIPFVLQDLIRVPINLYFLFELLKRDTNITVVSSNSLNRNY